MICLLAVLAMSTGERTLVFVRHGETLANSTGHYDSATIDRFSAKGSNEVAALTTWLERQPRFDEILVSPSPRALRTIAPYLQATHQRAVVWPLLYECCTGPRSRDARPTRFSYGARIEIPRELSGLFTIESGEQRLPVAEDYNAGLAQVAAARRAFQMSFKGGRVLMVGHSGMGGHFLHDLTGRWTKLENATPVTVKL